MIGLMTIDEAALEIGLEQLRPDDFMNPDARLTFQAIADLWEKRIRPDYMTLQIELERRKVSDGLLGEAIREASGNPEYLCQIIRENGIRRRLSLLSMEVGQKSRTEGTDVYDVLDFAYSQLGEIQTETRGKTANAIWDFTKDVADKMIAQMPGDLTGLPIGLPLDKMTGGWQPGDYIIIGARPSMGKSVLGFQACLEPALRGIPTGFISLEMSKESVAKRLLISAANLDGTRARFGKLNEMEKERLAEAAARIATPGALPIYIDDSPTTSAQDIRLLARKWIREYGIKMLVVDYLQITKGDRLRNDNREQEVSRISSTLKQTAKETGIPIIALAQLSRPQKGYKPKAPQLDDLRESGSIEQDADVVIFIHRPEYYGIKETEEGASTAGLAELVVAKQRNGSVGTIEHFWNRDQIRFEAMKTQSIHHDEPVF